MSDELIPFNLGRSLLVSNASSNTLDKRWKWKDRFHNYHYPEDMKTSHIYHTLKMIWNHRMPEVAKIHPYKKYDLKYKDDYLKAAIRYLTIEISKRDDMSQTMEKDFQKMIAYLRTHQLDQWQEHVNHTLL